MSKRKYTHIGEVEKEVLELLAQGKTQREVAEHFGFTDKYVVKEFVKRHRRKAKRMEVGIMPRPKGHPRKDAAPFDNSIVAYKTSRQPTVNLVLDTVRAAVEKEAVAGELQLHSDQGLQYTSQAYFTLTQEYGITPSMSRRGNP